MITRTQSYQTSDGATFAELADAQAHEIEILFAGNNPTAVEIVTNTKQIIDILTTGPNSRPSARAVNGGRKPRKPKANVAPTGPTQLINTPVIVAGETPTAEPTQPAAN